MKRLIATDLERINKLFDSGMITYEEKQYLINKYEEEKLVNDFTDTVKNKVKDCLLEFERKLNDMEKIDFSSIVKKIQEEYNFLYNAKNYVAGYNEALDEGEAILRNEANKPFISELIKQRGDFFSSDREIAALAFALDSLGYLGSQYGVIVF